MCIKKEDYMIHLLLTAVFVLIIIVAILYSRLTIVEKSQLKLDQLLNNILKEQSEQQLRIESLSRDIMCRK